MTSEPIRPIATRLYGMLQKVVYSHPVASQSPYPLDFAGIVTQMGPIGEAPSAANDLTVTKISNLPLSNQGKDKLLLQRWAPVAARCRRYVASGPQSISRWLRKLVQTTRHVNGKGRKTPVADAATLVEIAWLCPGKAADVFRRKGAESVCRMLGGDLSLVDEIQRRHAQVAGTEEEEFLLANAQSGSTQQAVSHKRCLDDDVEVYAARKQQVLRQISQQTIREHAQGSMGILDMLSTGETPPATLQLLQTIRHNVTARLGSMIESGMLAIEAVPQQQQQQELSINQQAQGWTVQMYANKLGLPAAAYTAAKLKAVGAAGGKIWSRERLLPTIARSSDGALIRVWFEPGSNTAQTARFVPEEEPHLFAEARMKYSLAYKGGYEAADSANFDTWTYPAETGAQVIQEAFQRVAASLAR